MSEFTHRSETHQARESQKAHREVRISIPADLHRELKMIAAASGKPMKELIVELLREALIPKAKQENIINLSEFCKGLTMKECVEKIKKEIPDYKNKLYQISIEI